MLQAVEKEHHAEEEQQVIVAGHHVFGPEIHEGDKIYASDFLDVAFIADGDAVPERLGGVTGDDEAKRRGSHRK